MGSGSPHAQHFKRVASVCAEFSCEGVCAGEGREISTMIEVEVPHIFGLYRIGNIGCPNGFEEVRDPNIFNGWAQTNSSSPTGWKMNSRCQTSRQSLIAALSEHAWKRRGRVIRTLRCRRDKARHWPLSELWRTPVPVDRLAYVRGVWDR
jgi:hypothetical protein